MKKIFISLAFLFSFIVMQTSGVVSASDTVDIKILSPDAVENYPGLETTVQVEITNLSSTELKNAMVYITMADIGKHMTVNLEDYGADVPVLLDTLKPQQSVKVELPIRFVYTSKYKLYVTVSSDDDQQIHSSESIPVHILGNTKIDPLIVQIVSIAMPVILLLLLFFARTRKKQ
ncbi:hypothetical protein ACFVR1_05660 [Psychrobacillus sp. NPDC058041]|uniref:hypothetical protein n=1 Tax=Psychrobacillus sp. NPDC058041 TaxID=3346310 RepID=UPI0036DDE0F5